MEPATRRDLVLLELCIASSGPHRVLLRDRYHDLILCQKRVVWRVARYHIGRPNTLSTDHPACKYLYGVPNASENAEIFGKVQRTFNVAKELCSPAGHRIVYTFPTIYDRTIDQPHRFFMPRRSTSDDLKAHHASRWAVVTLRTLDVQ